MLWLIYGINCPNIVLFGPQKIKSLGLSSHFPFCLKFDFSLFPMLISPLKQGWNEKIRTLLLTKLFEVLEWKWPYFWDLVIFWCCKSSIKNPNFGASAINREWLNYHGTKSDGSFCSYLTPVELLLKSKKIEAPYCVHKRYENFSSKRVQKVPNEGKLISRNNKNNQFAGFNLCNEGSQLSLTYELQLGTWINSHLLFTALIFVQGRSICVTSFFLSKLILQYISFEVLEKSYLRWCGPLADAVFTLW